MTKSLYLWAASSLSFYWAYFNAYSKETICFKTGIDHRQYGRPFNPSFYLLAPTRVLASINTVVEFCSCQGKFISFRTSVLIACKNFGMHKKISPFTLNIKCQIWNLCKKSSRLIIISGEKVSSVKTCPINGPFWLLRFW